MEAFQLGNTSYENNCNDALVSGKMRGFPTIYLILDTGHLEIYFDPYCIPRIAELPSVDLSMIWILEHCQEHSHGQETRR